MTSHPGDLGEKRYNRQFCRPRCTRIPTGISGADLAMVRVPLYQNYPWHYHNGSVCIQRRRMNGWRGGRCADPSCAGNLHDPRTAGVREHIFLRWPGTGRIFARVGYGRKNFRGDRNTARNFPAAIRLAVDAGRIFLESRSGFMVPGMPAGCWADLFSLLIDGTGTGVVLRPLSHPWY
jgi:hypothetical protein